MLGRRAAAPSGCASPYWGTGALWRRSRRTSRVSRTSASTRPSCSSRSALALVTSLVFGCCRRCRRSAHLAPAGCSEGGRERRAAAAGHRVRAALVVAEMALAVVLLTGAGLLVRSFVELTRVDPGFEPKRASRFA